MARRSLKYMAFLCYDIAEVLTVSAALFRWLLRGIAAIMVRLTVFFWDLRHFLF